MADVMSVLEVIDMERRKDLQGLISALNYQAKAAVRAEPPNHSGSWEIPVPSPLCVGPLRAIPLKSAPRQARR